MTRGFRWQCPPLNTDSELDYAALANGQDVIVHMSNGTDDSHASGTHHIVEGLSSRVTDIAQ